jgi:hypothetical protein
MKGKNASLSGSYHHESMLRFEEWNRRMISNGWKNHLLGIIVGTAFP